MDSNQTDIIDRIRKILLKTEQNGCTAEEAAAAFERASRLMTEHNLDMAKIQCSSNGEEDWKVDVADDPKTYGVEHSLASAICTKFFFVMSYTMKQHGLTYLLFFGKPENVATAQWTYRALKDAFDRLFHEYRKQSGAPASDRRLFITGVANGFTAKLTDERRAHEIERDIVQGKSSGSTTLAIRELAAETKEAFDDQFGEVLGHSRRSCAPVTGNASALNAGIKAGKSLNLNRSVGRNGQKQIA